MAVDWPSTDAQNTELSTLQKRNERLKLSNDDTIKQLLDTTGRWKRLAKSLGFNDVHEAQVTIDTADEDMTYKECFERVHKLEEQAKSDTAALERLRDVDEENKALKTKLKFLEEENKYLKTQLAKTRRNKRLFPLDIKATEYLLGLSPTFSALLPLILTSKFVYGVFQAQRKSIVHTIALNHIGNTLPQALRLARCEDARLLQFNVEGLPKEEDLHAQEITPSQARILTRNAGTVQELEDYYSFRRKDRTSRTSVLTRIESQRFRRALYRIMLLSFTYGLDSIPYLNKAPRQYFLDPDELDRNYVKQKRFLDKYVSEGLCEIYKISKFLQKVAFWAVGADGGFTGCPDVYDWDLESTYLAAGPAVVLDCYKNKTAHMHLGPVLKRFKEGNGPYAKFLMLPVGILLKERGITKPGPFETVLDNANGGEDRCCHCQMRFLTVNLWNESNWDDLKGDMGLDLHLYFKGKLFTNAAEKGLISTLKSIDYSKLMHEMYDSKRGVYLDWTKEKSVCFDCIEQFFLKTIPFWWLDRKRKARTPIMKDCWYGYDCPEQKQLRHAQLFNHLCEPTRKVPIVSRIEDSY